MEDPSYIRTTVAIAGHVMALLWFSVSFGSLPASANPIRVIGCTVRNEAIRLDGLLSEPVWHQLAEHGGFVVTGERSPHHGFDQIRATDETSFRVFLTADTLYAGVLALREKPELANAKGALAGDGSDHISVCLARGSDRDNYVCISITSDGRVSLSGPAASELAARPKVAAIDHGSSWSAEVGFPVEQWGEDSGAHTDTFGFNVERSRSVHGKEPQRSFWHEQRGVVDQPCTNSMIVRGPLPFTPTSLHIQHSREGGSLIAVFEWEGPLKDRNPKVIYWLSSQGEEAKRHRRVGEDGRSGGSTILSIPTTRSGPDILHLGFCDDAQAECPTVGFHVNTWNWPEINARMRRLTRWRTDVNRAARGSGDISPEAGSAAFLAGWLPHQFENSTFETARLLAWLEKAERLAAGKLRLDGEAGLQNRAIWSTLDQTLQPYTLWVPENYSSDREWPVVVVLHGGMPTTGDWASPYWENEQSPFQAIRTVDGNHVDDWLTVDFRRDFVILAPRGRRSGCRPWWDAYEGPAIDDILASIADCGRTHRIDENRLYLIGLSLGGWGATSLATKLPDRWAAVVANCVGWKAFRHRSPSWSAWPRWKKFVNARFNPVDLAENLTHVPFFFQLSDKDRGDLFGRPLAHRLQRLGAQYLYWEKPRGDHCETFAWGPRMIERWFRTNSRDPFPRRVHHKTGTLRHGRAYWLSIEQFERPIEFAETTATASADGLIEILSTNVARLSLDLKGWFARPGESVRVLVNHGVVFDGVLPSNGVLTIGTAESSDHFPGEKRPRMEGPIADAVLQPFVLVYGTAGDPEANAANRFAAERMADLWRRSQNVVPRMKSDRDILEDEIRVLNLICFGGAESNSVVRRCRDLLPVKFEAGAVQIGRTKHTGRNIGVRFVYPNPLSPDHLIQVNAGTSAAMRRIHEIGVEADFIVFDDKTAQERADRFSGYRVFGWFDQQWRLRERYLFQVRH